MLRLTSNMRLFVVVVVVMVCQEMMMLTSAVSRCDPLTQYDQAGQCCTMCAPGTKMLTLGTCSDPQCAECGPHKYQDEYTRDSQCKRQPYCDPNKNLEVSLPESKKKESTCTCLPGFHCSSVTCVTCVPHTTCEPGQWAKSVGNHTRDTVCESCPEGSFSVGTSSDSVCTKWTECESGFHVQEKGTHVSDIVCEKSLRHQGGLIAAAVVIGSLLIVVVLASCVCRAGDTKQRAKGCLESCRGDRENLPREPCLLLFTQVNEIEKDPEPRPSQEEEETKIPEENLEEQRDELLSEAVLSENGQFVTQERGKGSIQPQQETEAQTCTDGKSSF
ncbi:tumor necrosis factor receptor superfamily member 5 isoform X1 [Hippoglossus stenolepis]|uniref:tumor necrosis factor receptor superfamily member 5 isoform X1 n=1 Tax=Hippoglossus stenolepis TaxID=195615 RepID=UPI001FB021ED|nr:tumor necrosis factor receptor superfamily member 5 isoform X1 [Hippoglossus stenolepis]